MNTTISSIETLPNELLTVIFEYISPDDLYHTFFNQNSRFNSIITYLKHLHLILEEDWDNDEHYIPCFIAQISSLIIKHDKPIDFSLYSNIRSLKLSMPTFSQCNAIQPCLLPNLEHLFISNLFYKDYSDMIHTLHIYCYRLNLKFEFQRTHD